MKVDIRKWIGIACLVAAPAVMAQSYSTQAIRFVVP